MWYTPMCRPPAWVYTRHTQGHRHEFCAVGLLFAEQKQARTLKNTDQGVECAWQQKSAVRHDMTVALRNEGHDLARILLDQGSENCMSMNGTVCHTYK